MKLSEINLLNVGHTIGLVGAVYSGEGKLFLALFPEHQGSVGLDYNDRTRFFEGAKDLDDVRKGDDGLEIVPLNMDVAEWERFVRQTDLLETEVLTKASDGTLAKIILRKSTRAIDTAVQWKTFKRDAYRCAYCGKDDAPLTIDHLVTWEEGGPTVEANLLTADRRCNKMRGNLAFAEWLQHPYYKKVSVGLTPERRAANEALLATLDKIPRMVHTRSR